MLHDDRFRGLTLQDVRKDLIAGITVGIVAIPLGMAFAIASGVKPEYGIYTTIIAGILVALLGGSRFQIAGPTGAFIPILLAIVLQYGYENLLIAGFLAGIILLFMGFFKLGSLIKFIPRSVTIGFTAGIAVIIFTGQIGNFFGLEGIEKKELFHENMLEIIHQFHTLNWYSALTALIGLAMIIMIPRIAPRVPILLVALLIPTIIAMVFYPDKIETIGAAYGGIPSALPTFHFPEITLEKIINLWRPAFVIAFLGGIESLLSAVVADGMTGKRHHSNRELIGQGVANIVTPLFGGIPATGAIARTATNIKSGAKTPLSGIFQGVFVLITLLLFAPYASFIPLASMAPILMIVAWNMSESKSFAHILKLKKGDSIVLIVTFLLTVFVNLTVAVEVGLLLAMVSFIRRMSGMLDIEKLLPIRQSEEASKEFTITDRNCPEFDIYTIEGPLFFGTAAKFEQTLSQAINKRPKILLLRMNNVQLIDASGEGNLSTLVKNFQKRGGIILISGIGAQPLQILKNSGLYYQIGANHVFEKIEDAVNYANSLLNNHLCKTCRQKGFEQCGAFNLLEEQEKAYVLSQ
ncbi:sodium-independent anion transporter [Pueribacillus theae]|uniref:Sodium-independent anion transporter n=1 Tax=Pueribacillus theae TaxID=2171751 RepID=A0A2U1JTI7_9BACI|nr:sulfate permease [Pueribacillus theae]PWA08526.1 sodium-independent anion transporter [Pueribacillus theae]